MNHLKKINKILIATVILVLYRGNKVYKMATSINVLMMDINRMKEITV